MINKTIKAGEYYRVSTRDKQDSEMALQKTPVRELAERERIKIIKTYVDVGQSGAKESRPEFDKMISDIRNNIINCVIVYRLDRIGRSLPHLVKLFEEFSKKNIKFISATQNFNTTTAEGELMLRMLMILADYERKLIISRVNDGLSVARSKGVQLGRRKGSKDKKPRRRSGYWQRWAKQSTPTKQRISIKENETQNPT